MNEKISAGLYLKREREKLNKEDATISFIANEEKKKEALRAYIETYELENEFYEQQVRDKIKDVKARVLSKAFLKKEKLKPCPYCGAESPYLFVSGLHGRDFTRVPRVVCANCGAIGPYDSLGDESDLVMACILWNTREPSEDTEQEDEKEDA